MIPRHDSFYDAFSRSTRSSCWHVEIPYKNASSGLNGAGLVFVPFIRYVDEAVPDRPMPNEWFEQDARAGSRAERTPR